MDETKKTVKASQGQARSSDTVLRKREDVRRYKALAKLVMAGAEALDRGELVEVDDDALEAFLMRLGAQLSALAP